jgi:hypothetical protein
MVKESFMLTDVRVELNGNVVGGCQSVSVSYEQENTVVEEGGNKFPREILDGNVKISGTVEQLFLDADTIKELVDIENGRSPYFDLVGITKDKDPGVSLTVVGAKFRGFSVDMGLTDATTVSRDYDALRIRLK